MFSKAFSRNPVLDNKYFALSKLKAFVDKNFKIAKMMEFFPDRVENCVKRRKLWLPAFSPFLAICSKAFFIRIMKTRDCLVKGDGCQHGSLLGKG